MFDKYVEIGEENIVPEDIGKGRIKKKTIKNIRTYFNNKSFLVKKLRIILNISGYTTVQNPDCYVLSSGL